MRLRAVGRAGVLGAVCVWLAASMSAGHAQGPAGSAPAPAAAGAPAMVWGGDQVQLLLDATGGVLKAGCAQGRLGGPVQWRSDGGFSATGSFDEWAAGPQLERLDATPRPARFEASARAGGLELRVTPQSGEARVYLLMPNRRSKVVSCG